MIEGEGADPEKKYQISGLYGFEVHLRNLGNIDINEPTITVTLEQHAQILNIETMPTSKKGFEIVSERDQAFKNMCRVTIPYINAKQGGLIRILSTSNQSYECLVEVTGAGIKSKPIPPFSHSIIYGLLFLIFSSVVIPFIPNFVPRDLLITLGGHTTTSTFFENPGWIIWVQNIILYIGYFLLLSSTMRDRDFELNYGGWDHVKRSSIATLIDIVKRYINSVK